MMCEAIAPESTMVVIDEWSPDRLIATALDYADLLVVVAAARGVIRGELVRRCHLTNSTAGEIATAITSEVVDALVENFCTSANALTMN